MSQPKRATVYFDEDVHRALRLRAAAADRSISEMVNDAVRRALAEDADDLAAVEDRRKEPTVDFATFVRDMKKRGRL
jgi:plasmid stability protein